MTTLGRGSLLVGYGLRVAHGTARWVPLARTTLDDVADVRLSSWRPVYGEPSKRG